MNFCKSCGAGLGLGRFCTNCGTPIVPAVDPTADVESPAEKTQLRMPAVQPDASTGARYPLYADEVATRAPGDSVGDDIPLWTSPVPVSRAAAPPSSPPPSGPPPASPLRAGPPPSASLAGPPPDQAEPPPVAGNHRGRERSSRAGWIVAAVLLLILCSIGVGWLLNRDGGADAADSGGNDTSQGADEDAGTEAGEGDGTGQVTPPPDGAAPADLAGSATAAGPAPVPPSTDFDGNKFSYPPKNMLDDDPESAYRLDGDASGTSITFDLPEESTIREVGLVNGFTKTATAPDGKQIDWYSKNRRILEVEWLFDDGSSVTQTLKETSDLQTISVDGAVTEEIELRIVKVSEPGGGKWSKDVTSISSVLLRGSAG